MHPTLLNRKVLVPSTKTPYVAVEQHFLKLCMDTVLRNIQVDEVWYLTRNPDIKEAIEAGTLQSAKGHYCAFGFFEHRMPHHIAVDEVWYMSQYPDVLEAIRLEHFESGQHHFELIGFKEGRIPYPNFRLEGC
jgi:hypothetical protein